MSTEVDIFKKQTNRPLTAQEQTFIDALFENGGNVMRANITAGYHPTAPTVRGNKTIQDALIEQTRFYLAANAPKAAKKMVGVLDNPTELGTDKLLEASKQILDRVGVIKKEQLEIEANMPNAVLILPQKNKEE